MPTDWYFRVDVTCSRLQKLVEFAVALREPVSKDDPAEDWIQKKSDKILTARRCTEDSWVGVVQV